MSSLQPHTPNHTVDPQTGFLESNAYVSAFNGERKEMFIRRLVANGLSLYNTCDEMGLSVHTVNKHYKNDPAFKQALDEARRDYADRLDGISKVNAMNPKSVIERIFQLKALFPERYADQKSSGSPNITLQIDGKTLEMIRKRDEVIEAQVVAPSNGLATESTGLSDSNSAPSNNSGDNFEQPHNQ